MTDRCKLQVDVGCPQEFDYMKFLGPFWTAHRVPVQDLENCDHTPVLSFWEKRDNLKVLCSCGEKVRMHRSIFAHTAISVTHDLCWCGLDKRAKEGDRCKFCPEKPKQASLF